MSFSCSDFPGPSVPAIPPSAALQSLIIRTAAFVRQSGPAFAAELLSRNRHNSKFSFLSEDSPFHPFYESAVRWGEEVLIKIQQWKEFIGKQQKEEKSARGEEEKISAPVDFPSRLSAVSLSPLDLKSFSPSFPAAPPAFLKIPSFPSFCSSLDISLQLVCARFSSVLPPSAFERLGDRPALKFLSAENPGNLFYRELCRKFQEIRENANSMKIETIEEAQRCSLSSIVSSYVGRGLSEALKIPVKEFEGNSAESAAIDWNIFQVAEIVEFPEASEALPEPKKNIEEIRQFLEVAVGHAKQAEEEKIKKQEIIKKQAAKIPITANAVSSGLSQVCPLCGVSVPVDSMSEHMRLELLSPGWQAQQATRLARAQENRAFAQPEDIAANLRKFRQDGGEKDEARKKLKIAANQTKQEENKGKTGKSTNAEIVQNSPTLHIGLPQQPFPQPSPPSVVVGPPISLLSEAEFLASSPPPADPVRLEILFSSSLQAAAPGEKIPNGLVVSAPLSFTVENLKSMIAEEFSRLSSTRSNFPIALNRLKLSFPMAGDQSSSSSSSNHFFLNRDHFSLASYNCRPGQKIFLALKERGGKKK